jgi:DNA-binding MarR family transcriptional regulator
MIAFPIQSFYLGIKIKGYISMSRHKESSDAIDARREQWRLELPDVDTKGMGILGRARWITLNVRPHIESVFADHGLDTGEFDVLATLLRAGPPYRLRPTELYRALMVSSGGMTDRLNRLEKLGHVSRMTAEGDGRSTLVELTPCGRTLIEQAFRADMRVECDLLSRLSPLEQVQLETLLRKLVRHLEEARAV